MMTTRKRRYIKLQYNEKKCINNHHSLELCVTCWIIVMPNMFYLGFYFSLGLSILTKIKFKTLMFSKSHKQAKTILGSHVQQFCIWNGKMIKVNFLMSHLPLCNFCCNKKKISHTRITFVMKKCLYLKLIFKLCYFIIIFYLNIVIHIEQYICIKRTDLIMHFLFIASKWYCAVFVLRLHSFIIGFCLILLLRLFMDSTIKYTLVLLWWIDNIFA